MANVHEGHAAFSGSMAHGPDTADLQAQKEIGMQKMVMGGTLASLIADIDDYCGNGRPGWPRPRGLKDLVLALVAGDLINRIENAAVREPLVAALTEATKRAQEQIG